MHRFFVDRAPAERAFLTGEQARQIATVLRLQPGERVILVADLIDHEVELQAVAPAQVTGKVVARRPVSTELPFRLTLAVAVLKGDRTEEVIEAASRVDEAVPYGALFVRLAGQRIVLWEEARGPHLLDAAREDDVSLVVGPEGGLTAEEIDVARQHDAVIASLGSRILRAETAGIAAVAMLVGARDR